MNAEPKCPAPSVLADMAWEIKALLDALDELMPLDTFDGVSLHALAQIGSARARELANHLSVIIEVRHV
ncbi:hypothetical protein [Achromobacter sp. Root565]|uniref:hypothetical protein n=1 Tax=Achromobacter sp. Root565 TaxID=1736564 RepID=UPI0006F9B53F|nr:hypothetical protein [Achromobacter sp. Root565]KQZ96167.1 hypothetical protein ASD71_26260 [Achromobacter sp. Root565]